MTATTNDTRPPVAPDGGKPTRGAAPAAVARGVRSRRRPWLMATGGILAILGALGALWLVSSAGDRVSVVALARDVPYGAVITEADLQVVNVSVDPALDVVPADRLSDAVGSVAAVGLTSGALLTDGALGDEGPPTAGEVMVGVAVPAGRMPTERLSAGDVVLVVETPDNGGESPTDLPRTVRATVVRAGEPDLNGMTVVDVTVDDGDGPALAALSATGRIALVLEPREG